jgi:hypothetical protein
VQAARPSKWLAWSLAAAWILRVRAMVLWKTSYGLSHRIFPLSAGCLSLKAFSRSSAPHIFFEYE